MKQILLNIWYGLQYIAQCIVFLIGSIIAASFALFPFGLFVVFIFLYIIALLFAAGIEIYGYKIPFIVILLISIPFSLLFYHGLRIFFSDMKEFVNEKNKQYEHIKTTPRYPHHDNRILHRDGCNVEKRQLRNHQVESIPMKKNSVGR